MTTGKNEQADLERALNLRDQMNLDINTVAKEHDGDQRELWKRGWSAGFDLGWDEGAIASYEALADELQAARAKLNTAHRHGKTELACMSYAITILRETAKAGRAALNEETNR